MKKFLILVFLSTPVALIAQVIELSGTAVIAAAPAPFLDVSKVFPKRFDIRKKLIPANNTIHAWYIAADQIKNPPAGYYRSLSLQTLTQLDAYVISNAQFSDLISNLKKEIKAPEIQEAAAEDVVTQATILGPKAKPGMTPIGYIDQSDDYITTVFLTTFKANGTICNYYCINVTCLIRQKLVLLSITTPDTSLAEYQWATKYARDWMTLLRKNNGA